MIFLLIVLSACTVKDDRLFQIHNSIDRNKTISNAEYKLELNYENKIAPNDRLLVYVYANNGLDSQVMMPVIGNTNITNGLRSSNMEENGLLVTQNGTVMLPLIGSIKITGYTEDQASKILINKYKRYIKNPYVTVKITNQRVIMIGEVKKPGIVPIINGTINLFEAIAKSGDLTALADRRNIKIIRGDLRNPEIREIDLTSVDAIRHSSLLLRPNDIVYVQPREMNGFNKAFSETGPFLSMISSLLNPFVQWTTIQGKSF